MKTFTVLSHNTFWFQGVPFPTDTPPGPDMEILSRLCAMYRKINPDVICLQEIQDHDTFQLVSGRLGMSGCYCRGRQLPQYGGAVFWHSGNGRRVRDAHSVAAEIQRMWQIVEITGARYSLRICNIHLPSQRQLGPERASAQRMADLLEAIRSCEREPDIIVGDFNEYPGGRVSRCLGMHGYIDAAVLADSTDAPTNIDGGRGDYIWIKKQTSDSFLAYNVTEKLNLACVNTGKQYLSDHLPLWITVEIAP